MRAIELVLTAVVAAIAPACDAAPPDAAPSAREASERPRPSPNVTSIEAVAEPPSEPTPSEPAPVEFDPATVTYITARVTAVHRDAGWAACGVIHSTGVIEVEVLDVGEPAPTMLLIISCPVDFGHRDLLEIGTILEVELLSRRPSWPTPPASRRLPEALPRRYVDAMTRANRPSP